MKLSKPRLPAASQRSLVPDQSASDDDAPEGNRRALRFVPALVGLVCFGPFSALIARKDAIVSDPWRDYGVMHLPLAGFVREELLAGRLPLWNPYVGCGQPLVAAQQALFYPLSTPICVACGANMALKTSLFLHLALCYAGTYLLARSVGLSRHASAYAGLLTTWSGALTGHLAEGHVWAVFQSGLMPWLFLALGRLLKSPGAVSSVLLGIVGSLCSLAAQPQLLYYALVGGIVWAGWSLWRGVAAPHRLRIACWAPFAAVVAVLIGAVQLFPVFELLREGLSESERGTAEFATTYALDGADCARLLIPCLNGSPFAAVPQFDASDHYHERVVYLGLAALPLAGYGLSRRGTARWQWAAACGVTLALNFSRNSLRSVARRRQPTARLKPREP